MSPARKWLVPLVITTAALFFFLGPMAIHRVRLGVLVRRLDAVEHPSRSRRLAARSEYGILVGNGNHCNFYAAELRETSLSEAELVWFYRRDSSAQIAFFDDGTLRNAWAHPRTWASLERWPGKHPMVTARPYLVYLAEDSAPEGDYSCH